MKLKELRKRILKDYPGLVPRSRSKPAFNGNGMRREICDFARDNGFVIHPKGYDYYVESFNMFNYCPCDKTRLRCPCVEAVEDVRRDGHCLCRLFWRDLDTFKEKMLG